MFFNRKKQPAIRSLIGEGTQVHGELRFDAGLRIDGEVLGDVVATEPSSLLVISENARVQGKVMAGHVIINGQVQGPVVADRPARAAAEGPHRRRRALRGP